MRETQEVESLRFAEAPLYPTPGGEPSELKETRLLGMQLQTKLREPFAESDASNEEIARRSGVTRTRSVVGGRASPRPGSRGSG
jgi:hypothetical protein